MRCAIPSDKFLKRVCPPKKKVKIGIHDRLFVSWCWSSPLKMKGMKTENLLESATVETLSRGNYLRLLFVGDDGGGERKKKWFAKNSAYVWNEVEIET